MNAAERVEEVLVRYRGALTSDQAILIAVSEAWGNPLDPHRPGDAAVIHRPEVLLGPGVSVRDAIDQPRLDAEAASKGVGAVQELTLPNPRQPHPRGELIDTCLRCGAGVGDDEWMFAGWDGKDWRFSGRTIPEAQRLAALRPLLCSGCAVRAKYKLIPAPEVESKASSLLLLTDQRRDRDVAVHRSKHRQVADPTTTHKEKT